MVFAICLFLYFWVMSLWAFLAFLRDKERAIRNDWRVAETKLLALALLGGWPGAKWAQHRFRHKTRKEPFRTLLNLCAVGPVLLALVAVLAWSDPRSAALLARITGPSGAETPAVTIRRGNLPDVARVGE